MVVEKKKYDVKIIARDSTLIASSIILYLYMRICTCVYVYIIYIRVYLLRLLSDVF